MTTGAGDIVLMTDFGSNEGSRPKLARAVKRLTGTPPVAVDARHFMNGGSGRATTAGRSLTLELPSGQDWLMSRDALNFNGDGLRHQFRVNVLGERVLRVCEHVQANPEAPCNELQGATSTALPNDALAPDLLRLAVTATRSLGLEFGGVDLALESGGVVFEVNVHPVLAADGGFESVAVPFVEAHLHALAEQRSMASLD